MRIALLGVDRFRRHARAFSLCAGLLLAATGSTALAQPPAGEAISVFERSESIASPSGLYTVAVSSKTGLPNQALSQAIVTGPNSGSGLIAFYLPRVSMGFVWKSDNELIVRYPDDLPAPRIDATKTSFGRGGKGRVTYEAVPRAEIKPLRWIRQGWMRTVGQETLERGALVTIDTDKGVEYLYSYYDGRERDSSYKALQAQQLQGGGYSWAGIIHGLVSLRAPEIGDVIELDPEADGLVVRSTHRAALVTVAQLVAAAKRDSALLQAAIERARRDGQME
jgi:immunity protein 51 of polymorphic toxin system